MSTGKNNLGFFMRPCSRIKAQLKIQEMAFMLMAVFLFFIMVGMFAVSILYSSIGDEATRIAEQRTIAAVTNLADSPEFSCVAAKSNCIDGDKLISISGNRIYAEFFPFSSLKVIKFSGFEKNDEELVECSIANYPDCDRFEVYDKDVKNERVVSSFVAFCRKEYENLATYDRCEVAKVLAGTEIREAGK